MIHSEAVEGSIVTRLNPRTSVTACEFDVIYSSIRFACWTDTTLWIIFFIKVIASLFNIWSCILNILLILKVESVRKFCNNNLSIGRVLSLICKLKKEKTYKSAALHEI